VADGARLDEGRAAIAAVSSWRVDDQLAAAWEVCLQPPVLDSFQVGTPSHLFGPSGQSHETVANAARLLVENAARLPSDWTRDFRWAATRALAESARYNGGQHLDAAGLLAAAGKPQEFWLTNLSGPRLPTRWTGQRRWSSKRATDPSPRIRHRWAAVLVLASGATKSLGCLACLVETCRRTEEWLSP
jgi:hypothetical protein